MTCLFKKTVKLESPFIELTNSKKSNIIIGPIYRHPSIDLDELNDFYLYS